MCGVCACDCVCVCFRVFSRDSHIAATKRSKYLELGIED